MQPSSSHPPQNMGLVLLRFVPVFSCKTKGFFSTIFIFLTRKIKLRYELSSIRVHHTVPRSRTHPCCMFLTVTRARISSHHVCAVVMCYSQQVVRMCCFLCHLYPASSRNSFVFVCLVFFRSSYFSGGVFVVISYPVRCT